jgi:hypothetical protein
MNFLIQDIKWQLSKMIYGFLFPNFLMVYFLKQEERKKREREII